MVMAGENQRNGISDTGTSWVAQAAQLQGSDFRDLRTNDVRLAGIIQAARQA